MSFFKIAVLISGRGSNLSSLIDNAQHYQVTAVISNNTTAPGLAIAERAGIPTYAFSEASFSSKCEHKFAVFSALADCAPDLVALAGFMQIVPREVVAKYFGSMVNIHPSLLPAYPGLDTHKRALAAGESIHGCTVHFVDGGVDTGPVIAQAKCQCCPADSEEQLASRVLSYEHRLYPWVVNGLACGGIRFESGKVVYDRAAIEEARKHQFLLPPPPG
jgi:phosphoribosylglycinamide formyltransferase 1